MPVWRIRLLTAYCLAESLLCPRVSPVVVAALLPESRPINGRQFHTLDPLRTLPGIQSRHYQAHRSAVVGVDRLSVVGIREQRIFSQKVRQREISRPFLVVCGRQCKSRLGFDPRQLEHRAGRDSLPQVAQPRPPGDAMKVGKHLRPG